MAGHNYPGITDEGFQFTSDCEYGCGCWMGSSNSGGPQGVDQFGACPKAPKVKQPDAAQKRRALALRLYREATDSSICWEDAVRNIERVLEQEGK